MYNPAIVFSGHALEKYKAHLFTLKDMLFFFTNNADDLHLGCEDRGDRILELMYELKGELEKDDFMLTGSGETYDDD